MWTCDHPSETKEELTGDDEGGKAAMLHEELLCQWISVQHFQIILAIIQKLQYFKVTLI